MWTDVGGLLSETMPAMLLNPWTHWVIMKIEYSPEGWPCRVTNPDGTQVRATYDGEGNVIQTINEIGATTQTQYTVNDEPSVIIDPQGAKTSIIYRCR